MSVFTKQEAAAALIDGAMRAYRNKDEVCAVVLAGAAEEAMPETSDSHRLDTLREAFTFYEGGKEEAIGLLSRQRNWLKSSSASDPTSMKIDQAIVMIVRAYDRYMHAYGLDQDSKEMRAFWHGARVLEPGQ